MSPSPTDKTAAQGNFGLSLAAIFVLLFLTIVVLTVTLTKQNNNLTTEDIAAVCGGQVQTAVVNGIKAVTEVCEPEEEAPPASTLHVPSSAFNPGFDYPLGWSVVTSADRALGTWNAQLNDGHISSVFASEGPLVDVTMYSASKTDLNLQDFTSFEDYLKTGDDDVTITSQPETSGTRYLVSGISQGMLSGPFEAIYFEGSNNWVQVRFQGGPESDSYAEWLTIKNSLDFSQIP